MYPCHCSFKITFLDIIQSGVRVSWLRESDRGTVSLLPMSIRLVTISLVRNEADIIETFVRHHTPLATRMVFVLHRCIDNTLEILEKLRAEGMPIEIHENADPGYPQSDVLTQRVRSVLREDIADWILPLDADEFLAPAEGRSLEDSLAALGDDRVHLLPWKTYVPTPEDDMSESNVLRRIVHRRSVETPQIRKVLLPVKLLRTQDWVLPMGCHTLLSRDSGAPLPSINTASVNLAHFPVRSSEQLCSKVLGGWLALSATPDRTHSTCYQWQALLERCSENRLLSIGELRNIALRYAMPEGAVTVPNLVRDAVTTSVSRPLYPARTATAVAVVLDAALACAELAGKADKPHSKDDMQSMTATLQSGIHALATALEKHGDLAVLQGVSRAPLEAHAITCACAMLAGVLRTKFPLVGTALTRRQQLSRCISPLPESLQWIVRILASDKLPHVLERAVQDILSCITGEDPSTLKQLCRAQTASDDVLLAVMQQITPQRATIPLPLSAFLTQTLQWLLEHEAGIEQGLGNTKVLLMDPACARGEIAYEFLRRSTHASLQKGAQPETLRKHLLQKMVVRDCSPDLLGIATIRMANAFADLHMPLAPEDELRVSGSGIAELTLCSTPGTIPVIGTALGKGSQAFHDDERSQKLLATYLRKSRIAGTDRDASASPVLRSIAHIHAMLRANEVGTAGMIIPRSILHEGTYATLREMLLEDCEQIRIVDLGGAYASSADDEAVDGSDESGTAILFLLRAPGVPQGTYYASWNGLRIQKYHALLSRGCADLPWKRIAPQKPGYVLLP